MGIFRNPFLIIQRSCLWQGELAGEGIGGTWAEAESHLLASSTTSGQRRESTTWCSNPLWKPGLCSLQLSEGDSQPLCYCYHYHHSNTQIPMTPGQMRDPVSTQRGRKDQAPVLKGLAVSLCSFSTYTCKTYKQPGARCPQSNPG